VSHAFAGLCERGNVEAAKFHDLRHTFCTRMVAAGVDLITLASITGHKSMDMLRRYTHPSDSAKVEAVRSTSHPRHTEPAERSEAAATR
jgi:site-specific recombinase XerD